MTESAEPADLRQGDLVRVGYVPVWFPGEASVMTGPTGATSTVIPSWKGALRYADDYLAFVCSHDCDIENAERRTGLILAPAIKVPAAPGSPQFESILSSAEATDGTWDFIHLFPLAVDQAIARQGVIAADFSALFTMARAATVRSDLRSSRITTLPPELRLSFRLKLAAFLGRDYQDPRPKSDVTP